MNFAARSATLRAVPNQKPKQPSLPLVVAIDGPSKSGKGTVSLELARHYGFYHLDTGAMYRLLTWHCLLTGVDIGKPEAVLNACLTWKTELVAIDHEIGNEGAVLRAHLGGRGPASEVTVRKLGRELQHP